MGFYKMEMNAETGMALESKNAEIAQILKNIITTTKGTLCLEKEFGTKVFEKIDSPLNASNKLFLFSEIYDAVEKNIADLKIKNLQLHFKKSNLILEMQAVFNNIPLELEVDL